MDYIIVLIIVLLAVAYLVRRFIKKTGNGTSWDCGSCPSGCSKGNPNAKTK